ncbi:unnamed protein product [Chilo suppressalis]|uniref:Protein krueppel n=1 Tax=Chilo suppressalis TaxID=168631 RepID=A0ABN8L5I5_CHISP|nr:unnamed protein product [Chilo suppressalis]
MNITSLSLVVDRAYTYEYFRDKNVCSLCWKNFTPWAQRKSRKNEVVYKIKDCLGIEFNDSCLPRKACDRCCLKVNEFYEFKQSCREKDRKLKEIIINSHHCNSNGFVNTHTSIPCEVKIENVDVQICDNSNNVDLPPCSDEVKGESEFLKTEELNETEEESKSCSLSSVFTDNCREEESEDEPTRIDDFHDDKEVVENLKKESLKNKKLPTLKSCNVQSRQSIHNGCKKKILLTIKKRKYQQKRSPTYCNICRSDLGSKENLVSHNASNHGIEEGNLFKCFGCEKRFRTRKARLSHEINFCKGLKEGYKCVKCNRFLPRRNMYEAHMRDHRERPEVKLPEKIFQCFKCYKLFKTKSCLTEHMAEHESLKKNYVCETCGRVFTRHDYLHKHRLTHTGTKQHACPHCGYRTSQKSSLTVHIRKHTGERPYSCDLCPQRCISSSNLRAHRRRHLGDKKFECTICSKRFGYKISLEEHVESVHERSQTYPCDVCGAIYTRARGLRRHLLAKHGKQKVDKPQPKDGSSACEESCGDQPRDGVSAKYDDVYLKIVDNIVDDKKVTVRESEVYEIKNGGEFVLLNSESGVILTKMY